MTILMPMETFVGLQTGKLQGPQVFMQGGMRLTGDMSMAMQMQALLV
jgi:putative sterol carrier protein